MLEGLDLHVTNRCNMRCIHCCYSSGEKVMDELTLENIKKVMQDVKTLGVQHIDIFGGEPTLRGGIAQIIQFAKSLEIKTELLTNGFVMDERKIDALLDAGLDSIGVSLDGTTKEVYQKIRGVDCVGRVIGLITKCIKKGVYTKVNTVLFRSNLEDIANIVSLSENLGVNEQRVYYFTPVGRGRQQVSEWVDPLVWLSYVRENLTNRTLKTKLFIETPFIEKEKAKNFSVGCRAMQRSRYVQVLCNGDVYPCAILASFHKPMGNIRDQSLIDLLTSGSLLKYNLRSDACVGYEQLLDNPAYTNLVKNRDFVSTCPCMKFPISLFKE